MQNASDSHETLIEALMAIGREGALTPAILARYGALLECPRVASRCTGDDPFARAETAERTLKDSILALQDEELEFAAEVALGTAPDFEGGQSISQRMETLDTHRHGYEKTTFKRRRKKAFTQIATWLLFPDPSSDGQVARYEQLRRVERPTAGKKLVASKFLGELLGYTARLHYALLAASFIAQKNRPAEGRHVDSRTGDACAEGVFLAFLGLLCHWRGPAQFQENKYLEYYLSVPELTAMMSLLGSITGLGPFDADHDPLHDESRLLQVADAVDGLTWSGPLVDAKRRAGISDIQRLYADCWLPWWYIHEPSTGRRLVTDSDEMLERTRMLTVIVAGYSEWPGEAMQMARDNGNRLIHRYYDGRPPERRITDDFFDRDLTLMLASEPQS